MYTKLMECHCEVSQGIVSGMGGDGRRCIGALKEGQMVCPHECFPLVATDG